MENSSKTQHPQFQILMMFWIMHVTFCHPLHCTPFIYGNNTNITEDIFNLHRVLWVKEMPRGYPRVNLYIT